MPIFFWLFFHAAHQLLVDSFILHLGSDQHCEMIPCFRWVSTHLIYHYYLDIARFSDGAHGQLIEVEMQIKVENSVATIRIELNRIESGNCGNLTQIDMMS